MTADELLEYAETSPPKGDGRNVWARFRPAAFVLREKGYHWPEIAQKFVEAGESIPNVESFCASMSRAYNEHVRKLISKRRGGVEEEKPSLVVRESLPHTVNR